MTNVFLFDVDGTLTPKGAVMAQDIAREFIELSGRVPTYISTSRTFHDLKERLPAKILCKCAGIYACSGSEYWEKNINLYRRGFVFSPILQTACEAFVKKSNFRYKTGHHILRRQGMLSISVVGLRAPKAEQLRYMVWDRALSERRRFITILNESKLEYDAYIGTNTCIEILPSDQNKSMIAEDLCERHPDSKITFFGDRIGRFGNDRPLAAKLREASTDHRVISVRSDRQTKHHIERLLSDNALIAS